MHQVGTHAQTGRAIIEPALIESLPISKEAHAVSISLDRVSVPMEEPRPRPKDLPPDKPPKQPVQRVFRMAWAATVTLHDEKGKSLCTLRYGRMPQATGAGRCLSAVPNGYLRKIGPIMGQAVILRGCQDPLHKRSTAHFLTATVHRRTAGTGGAREQKEPFFFLYFTAVEADRAFSHAAGA